MSFDMITAARELLDELAEHAALGGLADDAALFTLDVVAASNALDSGRAIVTVGPPSVELPTGHALDVTWEVIVAAGPHHDYLRSWSQLDKVAGALMAPPTAVESIRPVAYQPASTQRAYSAYQLTITTADNL